MDLIRELKDVRFDLMLRGYDCDAVDAFLAKIRGEIAELESQRERAQERVHALESQAGDGESDTEGTLRRTLVLAQRLADETVADAKQTAEKMVDTAAADASRTRDAAQSEADAMLAAANEEAATARETGRQELERAREDAARLSETIAIETTKAREDADIEAERILSAAEVAGAERVAALERNAQEEIAAAREPIRAEIEQLEQTRSALLADIEALETHLVEQRTRVRTAVEALRAGMSGSIDDLERVATDEDAMSPAPHPTLSGASSADVDEAPSIDIGEAVDSRTPAAPSVAELRRAVEAEHDDGGDEEAEPAGGDQAGGQWDVDEWSEPGEDIAEAEIVDDGGDETHQIPVVTIDDDADLMDDMTEDDEAVVDLDATPSALFGTDVAGNAEVVDAESSTVDAEVLDLDAEEDRTGRGDDGSFVDRFTQAIGDLPIGGRN